MNFAKIAIEEAKRLQRESHLVVDNFSSYVKKRRERLYRRLSSFVKDFNGLTLTSNRVIVVENSGSVAMFPCIRISEVMKFENNPLVDIFVEVTDDGKVQCCAECLWFDSKVRLTSESSERLMLRLAKQLGTILKVDDVLDDKA